MTAGESRCLRCRVVRRPCSFWPGHERAWFISYWYRDEWHACGYSGSHPEAIALMHRNWDELRQGIWAPDRRAGGEG